MAKKVRKSLKKIAKASDVPASQGQLEELRSEMKSEFASQKLAMRAIEKRIDAKFSKIDARFSKIDTRFSKFDARMNTFDARFDTLESMIQSLIASVHRTNAIVEEQNARNKFVIDGYKSVIDVQEDLNTRVKKLEKATFGIET